jgi:hypothetical protein
MTPIPAVLSYKLPSQLGANVMADDTIKKLTEALVAAQAMALTSALLTTDLYVHWILRQKNPAKSLRLAFDRINARLETGDDLERGYEKRAISEARGMIEAVFRKIDKTIETRGGSKDGAPR